jgi:hypothetical protein
MIKRITIGDLRLTFGAARIIRVVGVNSTLENGRHILMWDFDNKNCQEVYHALRETQLAYGLPDIIMLESKSDKNYLAYCFKQVDWIDAVRIVANTALVDYNFLKFGVYRHHFTLRVSPKLGRQIHFHSLISSMVRPDCTQDDLTSWVKYETMKRT